MFAQPGGSGARHSLAIERPTLPGDLATPQRWSGAAIADDVSVGATVGGKARVEIVGDRPRPQHADRAWQIDVSAEDPRAHTACSLGLEMDDLIGRVDASIGTAGAMQNYGMCGDALHGRLYQRLNRANARLLGLPATERRAVIFNPEGNAHQRSRARPADDDVRSSSAVAASGLELAE